MQVLPINHQRVQSFGMNFKLSKESINSLEVSTGLTYEEMTTLPLDITTNLMKQRGTLKEPSKIKLWLAHKYKCLGEKLGLLEKQINVFTDVD